MVLSGLPSGMFKENIHENLIFEKIEKIIRKKDIILKGFKKHYQATKKYFHKYNNVEQMAIIREQAYAAIDEVKPPREEEFLLEYVESGSLSDENTQELKNY